MYKKTWTAMLITSCLLVNPLFASNIFQKFMPPHATKTNNALKVHSEIKKNFTDFSGSWLGTCGDSIDTMTIKNSDSEITINGKDYEIGSLETEASSDEDDTVFFHTLFQWDADASLLINSAFIIYDHAPHDENVFGHAKGKISLKNEQLIFEVDIYNSGTPINTVCTYQKQ